VIRQRVEVGASAGFFRADQEWNPLFGPLFNWNDRLGSWGLSYRFGPEPELRFTRILLRKK